jgi:hypothetical protein
MSRDLNEAEKHYLERLIDTGGLKPVLEALSDIAAEKAEHIRTNWQDKHTARYWDEACGHIGCCSTEVTV